MMNQISNHLTRSAHEALANHGIKSVFDLATRSRSDIRRIKGVGRKTFDILAGELADRGLRFLDEAKSQHLSRLMAQIADAMAYQATAAIRADMGRFVEAEFKKMAKAGIDVSNVWFDDISAPMSLIVLKDGKELSRFTVSVKVQKS